MSRCQKIKHAIGWQVKKIEHSARVIALSNNDVLLLNSIVRHVRTLPTGTHQAPTS
ncbi:MAG: hypothetical protein M3R24_07320 [Chloroflexota bacterium]|nr:hypothetical protein [Chloroflexota bacterium]